MTKDDAYRAAAEQADREQRKIGIYLIGPDRYAVSPYRKNDETTLRESYIAHAVPRACFEK